MKIKCYMLYLTILSIKNVHKIFTPTFHFWNSKSAGWVDRVHCLRESPNKNLLTASLIVNFKCYILGQIFTTNYDDHENDLVEGYQLPQFPTEHLIWLYACFVHHPCGPGGDDDGHQDDVGDGDGDDGNDNAVKLQILP